MVASRRNSPYTDQEKKRADLLHKELIEAIAENDEA